MPVFRLKQNLLKDISNPAMLCHYFYRSSPITTICNFVQIFYFEGPNLFRSSRRYSWVSQNILRTLKLWTFCIYKIIIVHFDISVSKYNYQILNSPRIVEYSSREQVDCHHSADCFNLDFLLFLIAFLWALAPSSDDKK